MGRKRRKNYTRIELMVTEEKLILKLSTTSDPKTAVKEAKKLIDMAGAYNCR